MTLICNGDYKSNYFYTALKKRGERISEAQISNLQVSFHKKVKAQEGYSTATMATTWR